jgi:hypothetical protein
VRHAAEAQGSKVQEPVAALRTPTAATASTWSPLLAAMHQELLVGKTKTADGDDHSARDVFQWLDQLQQTLATTAARRSQEGAIVRNQARTALSRKSEQRRLRLKTAPHSATIRGRRASISVTINYQQH